MSVYRVITRIIPLNSSVSTFQPASFDQLIDGEVGEVKVLNLTEPNSGMKYRIERVEYVQKVGNGESVESLNNAYAEKLKSIPGFVKFDADDLPLNPYDKSFQLTLPKVISGKASGETSKSQQKKSTESFKISVVKNFNFKKATPKARKSMKPTIITLDDLNDHKVQSVIEDSKNKAPKQQNDPKVLFKPKYPSYLSQKLKHSVYKKKSSKKLKSQNHLNDKFSDDFSKKKANVKSRNGLTSHFVETNKGKNGRESLKIKISNLNHKEKNTAKNFKEKIADRNHKDKNAIKSPKEKIKSPNHKEESIIKNHKEKIPVKSYKETNTIKNYKENVTVNQKEKISADNYKEKDIKTHNSFDKDVDKTRNGNVTNNINNDTSSDMTDEASLDSDCGQLVISVLESVENGTIPEDLLEKKSENPVANKNPSLSKSSSIVSDDSLLEDSSSVPHQNGCLEMSQNESEDSDICKKFIVDKDNPVHDLLIALKKYFVNGECLICGFIPNDNNFNASVHMESHILSNSFASSYKCKCCHEKFSDPRNLYMHALSREKFYKYTCNICNLTFKRRHYLSRHTAKSH